MTNGPCPRGSAVIRHSSLSFDSSFVLRHSTFHRGGARLPTPALSLLKGCSRGIPAFQRRPPLYRLGRGVQRWSVGSVLLRQGFSPLRPASSGAERGKEKQGGGRILPPRHKMAGLDPASAGRRRLKPPLNGARGDHRATKNGHAQRLHKRVDLRGGRPTLLLLWCGGGEDDRRETVGHSGLSCLQDQNSPGGGSAGLPERLVRPAVPHSGRHPDSVGSRGRKAAAQLAFRP